MKKLMIVVLLATCAVACTISEIDENSEVEIQVIKKDEIKETDI